MAASELLLWGTLFLYIATFAFFTYFCMIADPDESKIAYALSVQLPRKLNGLATRTVGGDTMRQVHGVMDYFLVLVYLVVVLGSWSIIFFYVYPWIQVSPHVSKVHKTVGYFVFAACMWSWRKASTTPPGIITAYTMEKYNHYPYDNILFLENKICPTVGIIKLPRSKYDRFSRFHVPRFDHFCGWLHNPIGEENYRWFLLFLLIHVGMCLYGTTVCVWLFYGDVLENKLWEVSFYNVSTGEEFKATYLVVFQYLFQRHILEASVLLLMSVMTVMLGLFFGWHLWIASKGMTTNECAKWDQVKKWHKKQVKRYQRAVEEGLISDAPTTNAAAPPVQPDGDVTCTGAAAPDKATDAAVGSDGQSEEKDELEAIPTLVNPGDLPKNVYNRGFVENWKEVFYPRSLRPDAIERFRRSIRDKKVIRKTMVEETDTSTVTKTVTHYPPPEPPEKSKAN